MATVAGDDDFDQFDKPGAERSRRKRTGDEEWDSDLDDDLLGDDLPSAKKNLSDLSDEELNDELLQSDEEEESYSSRDAVLSMNSSDNLKSFDLSSSAISLTATEVKDPSFEQQDTTGVYEEGEEEKEGVATVETEEYAQVYYAGEEEELEGAEAEMTEDQIEYVEQDEELSNDEVIELEINETLDDEFQDEDYVNPETTTDVLSYEVEGKNVTAFSDNVQEMSYEAEAEESQELDDSEVAVKEESDEEEDEEEPGRLRFKKERKDGTVIRIIDPTNKRRNIPETLELSEEAKAKLLEFEEKERQRKQLRSGQRRGGRRGAINSLFHRPVEGRRINSGRGRMNDQTVPLMSVPVSQQNHPQMMPPHHSQLPTSGLFQNQQPQPLFPPHRHLRPMHHGMPPLHQLEPPRMLMPPPPTPQQPKNIHINPHFKGPVTSSMQVPLLPLPPEQPKLVLEPPRFPGSSEFQPHPPGPLPGNFTQVPRLPPPPPPPLEQWRGPPPPLPQDRNQPFFIGDPRFPGQQLFEQQNPPPPLLNAHPVPNQNLAAFNQSGQAFNQQGQQPLFPRERPLRPNLQPPSHMGMPHFNQPGPCGPRPFMPPRQQNPPGHAQSFPPPHIQHGMQCPVMPLPQPSHHHPHHHQPPPQHHSLQQPPQQQPPQQQLHHPSQQPLLPLPRHPFRQRIQKQQQKNCNRMQRQQRQGAVKAKRNIPLQNMSKGQNPQNQGSVVRNSNLRELPVAPLVSVNNKGSATPPAAQVKPVARSFPTMKTVLPAKAQQGNIEQNAKAVKSVPQPTTELKPETVDPDEDEETRLYRLKIEEQKKLREEILKQKELRRQQQAGARKKELLERLAQQQSFVQVVSHQQDSVSVVPANNNSIVPALSPAEQQGVKARLFIKKQGPGSIGLQPQNLFPVQTITQIQSQRQRKAVKQPQPVRTLPQNPLTASQKVTQAKSPIPVLMHGSQQSAKVVAVQGRTQQLKPGMKRTVMQRANFVGGGGPHLRPKKFKLINLTDMHMGENIMYSHFEGGPQQLQLQQPQLQTQQFRKVTLKKGAAVQPQQQMTCAQSALLGPRNTSGNQQLQTKAIIQGRGRALEGQIGRGRLMSNKQNLRVVECNTESNVVSIEGISSSTTDSQLKSLLLSVGPIQSFEYLPQQRKAIARFVNSAHAAAFQQKYHRHMVDLSHINVLLIAE
ncbi:RNA-binding protein 33 [Protopterus annectens]|uniref:RNA-binding protein 33 n=1 Tax=Protopterus annectens TaxID=7888 RepID=UPI001CFA8A64|nr:RNA-binding protein 33 [Protopterus annectens]